MKRLAYILMAAAFVFSSCAKEAFEHPTEGGVANASAFTPTVSVDQELNQVTFTLGQKGVVPVWVLQDNAGEWSSYNARDGFKKIFASAGDYAVRMYVMNSNGISPDYVEQKFHINNTIMSFDKYIRQISGGSEKVWRIDNSAEAHQACGESIANPTGWWAAKPDEKAAFGIYDNRLTFSSEGNYTFDPGESGTVYVNVGVTTGPYLKEGETADYTVPVQAQTVPYKFDVEGNDLVLKLQDGALFPYIPNNDFYTDTKFYVQSLDNNAATLVWYTPTGNGGGPIAWQFILTSKAGKVTWNGFKYNADSNLWKPADAAHTTSQWYAPGWNQIADAELTEDNGSYTLVYPNATTDQWQAQFFIVPDAPISLSADKNYDFSVIVSTSKELPGLTIKLTDTTDDGNFLFTERVSVPANEDYIFYLQDLPGIDAAAVKMVFDFGGNADDTEVTLKNIVLKDHAVDDGTVPPGNEEPVGPDQPGGYTYGENLLGGLYLDSTWFSAADWSGGLDAGVKYEGGKLTLTVPAGVGGAEWQGQVKLVADIPADTEKQYAFFANIESASDGVCTIKVADANDDSNHAFFYDNAVALTAYEKLAYKNEPVVPDQAYEKVMVIFDFGRMPAGTEITVTGIELKEITGESSGSGYSYGDELLGGLYFDSHWFSPASWAGGLDPQLTFEGGKVTLTVPAEVGGAEWQGQVKLVADIPADPEKQYSFACNVESSSDGVCTVKLADANDDSNHAFFYDNNVALAAYEQVSYKNEPVAPDQAYEKVMVIFDFGRMPAGTEITITGISLKEITGTSGGNGSGNGNSESGDALSYDSADNLWKPVDAEGGHTYSQYYATGSGWTQLANPEITQKGNSYSFTLDTETMNQWQAQFFVIPTDATRISLSAEKKYDFQCTVELSQDVPQVTFKLTDTTDDGNFLFTERRDITAYDTFVFTLKDLPGIDAAAVKMVFDFGGNPAGTEVLIKDIILREHK